MRYHLTAPRGGPLQQWVFWGVARQLTGWLGALSRSPLGKARSNGSPEACEGDAGASVGASLGGFRDTA